MTDKFLFYHLKWIAITCLMVGVCFAGWAFFFSEFVNAEGHFFERDPNMWYCMTGIEPEAPSLALRAKRTLEATLVVTVVTTVLYIILTSIQYMLTALVREDPPQSETPTPPSVDGHI